MIMTTTTFAFVLFFSTIPRPLVLACCCGGRKVECGRICTNVLISYYPKKID